MGSPVCDGPTDGAVVASLAAGRHALTASSQPPSTRSTEAHPLQGGSEWCTHGCTRAFQLESGRPRTRWALRLARSQGSALPQQRSRRRAVQPHPSPSLGLSSPTQHTGCPGTGGAVSRGGEGRASPGGTGRQQGSSPHSDPGCGVPGPPSAHLAHIPGEDMRNPEIPAFPGSPHRAPHPTPAQPSPAHARPAAGMPGRLLRVPSRRGLTPRGSLECNPENPAFPGEEY